MLTVPVSLLPPMLGAGLPAPNIPALSEAEQGLMTGLSTKLSMQAPWMQIHWSYYDGLQRLQNLGVSIPPQLAGVRTVVDWPRICIDPLVRRCKLDGFRIPGSTDIDDELRQHWQANDLDAEIPLGFLDSLVAGRGFLIVGSPDEPGDSPVVTVESPLNMSVTWDPRTKRITAGYQAYEAEGVYRAVLYLPDQTISMSREQSGHDWQVDDRDVHNFGEVPVVRLPNRARTSDREGRSEITAAIMNTTDSACRSLLGMEIAREFYSIPHRYILGASESDFTSADGTAKTALDMVMSKFLAFERDEAGNAPTVGQFQAFDPSVFTKIVDEHAQSMASYTGFPPSYFGQTTTANPASADAIRVSENGIDRAGEEKQGQFTSPLRKAAQLIWRFAHDGAALPQAMKRLEVDWVDASTPTPAATTDAMTKQASTGIVPPTSDVVLKRLGYTAVERQRLAQDRKDDLAAQLESELTTSIAAKQARTGNSVLKDLEVATVPPGASTATPPTG